MNSASENSRQRKALSTLKNRKLSLTAPVAGLLLALGAASSTAQELSGPEPSLTLLVTHSEQYRVSESTNPEAASANYISKTAIQDVSAHQIVWFDSDTWISDIGTLLFRDEDRDGYFSGFSLSIDVDTHFKQAEVYLSIGIQRAIGQPERLHTTQSFNIYGHSLADEYRIDIDLLSNYPAGDYDLNIDLHDAFDHRILDSVSAADFSNLFRLPLESEDMDIDYGSGDYTDGSDHHESVQPANHDIRVVEYTGSSGLFFLLMLIALVTIRSGKQQSIKLPQQGT
ncbi:MAG: choice-of-anchor H family protein [Granulosicoccus sp.]